MTFIAKVAQIFSGKKYLFLSLSAFFMIWFVFVGTSLSRESHDQTSLPPGNTDLAEDKSVYLYFMEPGGRYLTGEIRDLASSDDTLEFCRKILDRLIKGPAGKPSNALMPVLNPDTRILGVYIDEETVYVDLSSKAGLSYAGGVRSELLSVYSIVNTLVLNVDGITRVKILLDGNEAETFAGHIDIGYPLNAHMLLVR